MSASEEDLARLMEVWEGAMILKIDAKEDGEFSSVAWCVMQHVRRELQALMPCLSPMQRYDAVLFFTDWSAVGEEGSGVC